MKTIKLMTLMLAAMGMAACSNDDNDIIDNAQEQPLPLTITVTENPLQNPDAPAQAPGTRAVVTTTSTLSKFTLDYQYFYGESMYGVMTVSKDGDGKWTASGTWPSTTSEVSWYAHTDGDFISQPTPYLYFSVEEQANSQKDLLVANTSGTKSRTGGNLHFTFDHACTALKFYVKKSTNLDDYTLTVTSIMLRNIIKQGNYDFASALWVPGTTRTDYTLYSGSGKTLSSNSETGWTLLNDSEDDYLFMIPQTLTAWDGSTDIAAATTQTYIQLDCTITKNSDNVFSGTAYIPFGATLSAGYQYNVKINIGKNSLYRSPNTLIINN